MATNFRFAAAFALVMVVGAVVLLAFNGPPAADGSAAAGGCAISAADNNTTHYATLAGIVARDKTDVLLLGTSRTKYGLGPDVAAILGPTTNAAPLMASFDTMRAMLWQWRGDPGDRVIIEASFGTDRRNGLEHWIATPRVTERLVSRLDARPVLARLTGAEGRDKLRTDCHGFPATPRPPADITHFGLEARFRQEDIKFRAATATSERLAGLEAVIQDALDRGFRVTVWIPPVHACNVEGYRRAGYADAMDEWLRAVAGATRLTRRDGRAGEPVAAWDFSGYSAVTTEPLPTGDSEWRSQYFGDPGHVLARIGNRLARQMAGQPVPEGEIGISLDPAMIEAHIALRRVARLAYLALEPAAANACTRPPDSRASG